jgi:hypothetical protein
VPSGTNLLGLIKHLTCGELAYFGAVFDRPMGQPNPWFEGAFHDGTSMFARADEAGADVLANYRTACEMANSTIADLDLDRRGVVPWWGNDPVTLGQMMVHMTTETCRHAGHADFGRELIDGVIGYATWGSNVPDHDEAWGLAHFARVDAEARAAAARTSG